jgi:hypothetical protein
MERQLFITIPLAPTTGKVLGYGTTGGMKLDRSYYIENATLFCHYAATTTNTKNIIYLYKNQTTTICKWSLGSAVKQCTTTGAKTRSKTPSVTTLNTSSRIWVNVSAHQQGLTKMSIILRVREA